MCNFGHIFIYHSQMGLCLDTCLFLFQVIGLEEDVSVYDIADHPDFHFRTTDIVIRIWNSENGQNDCENEVRATKITSVLLSFICTEGVPLLSLPPLTFDGESKCKTQHEVESTVSAQTEHYNLMKVGFISRLLC